MMPFSEPVTFVGASGREQAADGALPIPTPPQTL